MTKVIEEFCPQVQIDREIQSGFKSTGWVVLATGSQSYVKTLEQWTEYPDSAKVFKNLSTAIAVCETMQYFSCARTIKVLQVTN